MAEVWVSFGRGFRLNLDGGKHIDFAAGKQLVDEALLGHWYVQANRDDLSGFDLGALGGTKDFLAEDLAFARQIMEEENESRRRLEQLHDLRKRRSEQHVADTISQQFPRKLLTPQQEALVQAARRQEMRQRQIKLAAEAKAGEPADAAEAPPAAQQAGEGNAPAKELDPAATQATGNETAQQPAPAPRTGRPSIKTA